MRTASSTFLFLVSLVIALASAWGAMQHDARIRRAQPASSPRCLAIFDSIHANTSSNSARDARAVYLREHIDDCRGDPLFVEQLVQELLALGEVDEAKSIFETASREHVFAPAEAEAVEAWIALGEARLAHAENRAIDAARGRARAQELAARLKHAWPEWAVPALLLLEVERSADTPPSTMSTDYLGQLQRARLGIRSGAFVRTIPAALYPMFIGGLVLIAAWSLLSGIRHWLDLRARLDLPATTIAEALGQGAHDPREHEVAVSGTLALRTGARELIAPFTKQPCLWYDRVLNYTNAKARSRLTSTDHFVVVDASGSLIIDPVGLRVETRHTNVTMGQSRLGYKRVKPTVEDRLHVGDRVYVRGILSPTTHANEQTTWRLTADRHQRSIVANIDPSSLRASASRWMGVGIGIACITVAILLWAMLQRAIPSVPGVLT